MKNFTFSKTTLFEYYFMPLFKRHLAHIFLAGYILLSGSLFAQSPVYFSSGNFTNPNNWSQASAAAMLPSAGSTYIHTTTANATPAFFRFYSATSGGTTYEPNGGADIILPTNSNTPTALQVTGVGKAYEISPASLLNTYVFKTDGTGAPGTARVIVFEMASAPVSVSSVSQSPAAGSVFPGQAVTVTATASAALPAGQAIYLRYAPLATTQAA